MIELTQQSNNEYKGRLYEVYVSGGLQRVRDLSLSGLSRSSREIGHYLSSLIPDDKSSRILELGCGHGALQYFLREAGYTDFLGIDISSEQVEVAHKLGIDSIICGDALEFLETHTSEFECIVGVDFIEHFAKGVVLRLLDAIFMSLCPGGRVILQTPNGGSPFASMQRFWDFTHEFALTTHSSKQILEATGFIDIGVLETGPFVHGIKSLGRVVLWQVVRSLLCPYLLKQGDFGAMCLARILSSSPRSPCRCPHLRLPIHGFRN